VKTSLAALRVLEVLDRVRHVDLAARDVREREGLVEQTACGTDERLACEIFVIARDFSDQHHARVDRALAEHGLRGVAVERAAPT